MAIDHQIKDKKLQYHINKEAAKISALSSRKIYKHEYLTDEEILPSNQKQIIEQAKFTYFPFEKQTKTIGNQGEKQLDALKKKKKLEAIKENKSTDNKKLLKYKEILDELSHERIGEIYKMSKQIDFNNLTYYFKDQNIDPINFINFNGPIQTYNKIKYGNIPIQKFEEDQKQFKSKLNEATARNPSYKPKVQLDTQENIENLYNSREKFKLYNGYAKTISESMYKTKQGTGIKILTPKQMLQRLPIAISQVKAGNNSENLLNDIRQIIH